MTDDRLTIYEKPTCTTCRNTVKLLRERGIEFEDINYYLEPLSAAKIAELLDKAGITPRDLMRTKGQIYKDLNLRDSAHSDIELIELMAEHPDLVQRPIAELGPRAVLCRPPERILELLG
ncbi:MAG: arsenate reductase family protein [Actinobacteria bacterium]|nr:arsenate reductase family protein [Actinomycetota bacterium]